MKHLATMIFTIIVTIAGVVSFFSLKWAVFTFLTIAAIGLVILAFLFRNNPDNSGKTGQADFIFLMVAALVLEIIAFGLLETWPGPIAKAVLKLFSE